MLSLLCSTYTAITKKLVSIMFVIFRQHFEYCHCLIFMQHGKSVFEPRNCILMHNIILNNYHENSIDSIVNGSNIIYYFIHSTHIYEVLNTCPFVRMAQSSGGIRGVVASTSSRKFPFPIQLSEQTVYLTKYLCYKCR